MPGFVIILALMILGAMIGFLFSKKGHEKEGAIKGAKTSCGCILIFTLLLIALFILVVVVLGGGAF